MNNNKKFLDTLKSLKGKSFVYAKETYTFVDYSIDDAREKVTIKTNKKCFERNYDSVEEFLTYWEPVIEEQSEELPAEQNNQLSTEVFKEQTGLAKDLINILKDNINKVQKDRSYIAQAQAINANVNSIINVTRLQLDMHKQFKSKKAS